MLKYSAGTRWLALFVLLLALLFAAFLWQRPLLHIGAGYAAKHACSCHFLQGRDLAEIRENDLNFSVLGFVSLTRDDRGITAGFSGLTPRRAVYREGVGCTLLNAPDAPLTAVGAAAGAGRGPAATVVTPVAELAKALDFGMAPVPGGGARGLVVMQDGRIVGERYGPGFTRDTPLLGWSMTKTLTGLAFGAALARDSTADLTAVVSARNLFPAWANDARANISLADLLRMNSGLAWNEAYGAISDATIMLHEQPAMAAYAAGMPAEEAPGDTWRYSSGTTNILVALLQRRLGPDRPAGVHLREVFGRVAPSLLIEPDQSGLPVGSSYGWATARDWARLGQFMLQEGVWEGDTLLPPGWVDWMRRPAAGSNGTYGGQLWLPGPDLPSLPADAYMMRGFQDQRVFVIPSRRLVIARLGHGEDQATDFDGLVRRILEVVD